jgi:hypothetical protein
MVFFAPNPDAIPRSIEYQHENLSIGQPKVIDQSNF